jgi:hypothetical protein
VLSCQACCSLCVRHASHNKSEQRIPTGGKTSPNCRKVVCRQLQTIECGQGDIVGTDALALYVPEWINLKLETDKNLGGKVHLHVQGIALALGFPVHAAQSCKGCQQSMVMGKDCKPYKRCSTRQPMGEACKPYKRCSTRQSMAEVCKPYKRCSTRQSMRQVYKPYKRCSIRQPKGLLEASCVIRRMWLAGNTNQRCTTTATAYLGLQHTFCRVQEGSGAVLLLGRCPSSSASETRAICAMPHSQSPPFSSHHPSSAAALSAASEAEAKPRSTHIFDDFPTAPHKNVGNRAAQQRGHNVQLQ